MALKLIPDPILRLGGGGLNVVNAAAAAQTYAQRVAAIEAASQLGIWPLIANANDVSPNGFNGAATAVAYSGTAPDGGACAVLDGSTSKIDLYGAGLAAAFNNGEITLAAWCKVANAGVWTDGSNDIAINLSASATNAVRLYKTSTNNQIQFQYYAGGTNKNLSDTSLAGATTWFHMAITVSKTADQAIAYLNGAQVGATLTGLGTWSGALASTTALIGALNTTPAQVWNGSLWYVAAWTKALSAAQVASLATV